MTAPKHFPPVEYLRECFDYDPETGAFRWRERPLSHFVSPRGRNCFNARFAGTPAFDHTNNKGYPKTNLTYEGEKFQIIASRVAWALVTGRHPQGCIDHRDCDRANTRFSNLREATGSQNGGNRRARADKLKGAFWDVQSKRYRSIITVQGSRRHLGYFTTEEAAHAAYAAAAEKHFGEFARVA